MRESGRISALVGGLATFLACTGGSQNPPAGAQAQAAPTSQPTENPGSRDSIPWLTSDSAGRTATLSLEVTRPAAAPSALINGYRVGEAQIVVPLRWTIRWNWRNADGTTPHSLVVMTQREKIPLEGGRSAFTNAMTRMVTAGLATGQTDQTAFEADEAGWYWLLCGVPNHALNGEWLELRVDPEALGASVRLKQTKH